MSFNNFSIFTVAEKSIFFFNEEIAQCVSMPDYYTSQPISRFRSIAARLNAANFNQNVVLFANDPIEFKSKFGIAEVPGALNAGIHELYAFASVRSLPDVAFPLYTGRNEDERLQLTLQYEWSTYRFELFVYLIDLAGNWLEFGLSALKNSAGHRFRRHRLIDLLTDNPILQIEEGWKIGVRLRPDENNLKLNDSLDSITITGGIQQEFVMVQPEPPRVVNNVFGGGTGTATYTPVVTLSLPNGESTAYTLLDTQIKIVVKGLKPSTAFTLKWNKDGTDTTALIDAVSDANGSYTATIGTNQFQALGSGSYKAKIDTQESNTITVIAGSAIIAPTNIPITTGTFTVTVRGLPTNQAYQLGWVKGTTFVSGSNTSRIFTPDTSGNQVLTLNSSLFDGTGYGEGSYKARISIGTITLDSNTFTTSKGASVTVTLSGGHDKAYIAEGTTVTVSVSKLAANTSFTLAFFRGSTSVSSSSYTADANGNYTGNFISSTFPLSFYPGTLFVRVTQGSTVIDSSTFDVVQLGATVSPTTIEAYNGLTHNVDVTGLALNSTFTLNLYKSNADVANTITNHTMTTQTTTRVNFANSKFQPFGAGSYQYKITKNAGNFTNSAVFTVTSTPSTSSGSGSLG